MRKVLSLIMILIGLVFISAPYLSNSLLRYRVNKNIDIAKEITPEEIEQNELREATFDYSSIQDVSVSSIIIGDYDLDNKSIIGHLVIDDLNINLPILKGVTDRNLMIGATTMVDGQEMGKGNYTLSGHYRNDRKTLFGPLLDIKKGSIVKITNKKFVYEYEIYETTIVPDTSMYMLDQDRKSDNGNPIISLMSCYYTSKNGKRFFALGELINEYPFESIVLNSH